MSGGAPAAAPSLEQGLPDAQGGPSAAGTGALSLLLPTCCEAETAGDRGQCQRGEQCLPVSFVQTQKQVSTLAGIGCSSFGVANLEITAGGFQHYPALGMNFKTL